MAPTGKSGTRIGTKEKKEPGCTTFKQTPTSLITSPNNPKYADKVNGMAALLHKGYRVGIAAKQ